MIHIKNEYIFNNGLFFIIFNRNFSKHFNKIFSNKKLIIAHDTNKDLYHKMYSTDSKVNLIYSDWTYARSDINHYIVFDNKTEEAKWKLIL